MKTLLLVLLAGTLSAGPTATPTPTPAVTYVYGLGAKLLPPVKALPTATPTRTTK